jgi:CRISPR/Cas system-associated exonuclease Cas4 (RecB family)
MPLNTIDDLLKYPKESLVDPTAQAEALSRIYDTWLEKAGEYEPDRKEGIHASEVAGCPRKLIYALQGTPREKNVPKNWRQRFQLGHAIHAWIQKDFHKMAEASGGALLFEDEVKIAPELQDLARFWGIQSSTDGVFTFREAIGEEAGEPVWRDVLRVILEIKSEAPDGYEKLKEPKPDHVEQAHVYMACLDVPLTWFLYINKANSNNTQSNGPWLIQFDHHLWHSMEKRFEEAQRMVAEGIMPDRKEGIYCEFCAFRKTCKPPYITKKTRPAFSTMRTNKP